MTFECVVINTDHSSSCSPGWHWRQINLHWWNWFLLRIEVLHWTRRLQASVGWRVLVTIRGRHDTCTKQTSVCKIQTLVIQKPLSCMQMEYTQLLICISFICWKCSVTINFVDQSWLGLSTSKNKFKWCIRHMYGEFMLAIDIIVQNVWSVGDYFSSNCWDCDFLQSKLTHF